jgi:hypothetical protein
MNNDKTYEERLSEAIRFWMADGFSHQQARQQAVDQIDWEDAQYNPDVYIPFASTP